MLFYPDVHIGFTFTAAGNEDAIDSVIESIAHYAIDHHATDETSTNSRITSDLGLPIIRALRAFHAGDYAGTVDLLEQHPIKWNHLIG